MGRHHYRFLQVTIADDMYVDQNLDTLFVTSLLAYTTGHHTTDRPRDHSSSFARFEILGSWFFSFSFSYTFVYETQTFSQISVGP
jgi:hypothetical protein